MHRVLILLMFVVLNFYVVDKYSENAESYYGYESEDGSESDDLTLEKEKGYGYVSEDGKSYYGYVPEDGVESDVLTLIKEGSTE